jgi:type I restriction enzyme M protein
MTKKITQEDLNKKLWDAANSSRGNVAAGVYMDYSLSMLFYKYLSDKSKKRISEYKERFGDDIKRVQQKMKLDRFYVEEKHLFDEVYKNKEKDDIGSRINKALQSIEDDNKEKLDGIFDYVDFNDNKLGKADQKNKMIRDLLNDFHDIDFSDVSEDILGESYMFLISKFGEGAGAKAGEFFSPKQLARLLSMLAKPKPGDKICDPACGSAGLLIMAGEEVEKNYNSEDYALYGQESIGTTYNLARMNAFLHEKDSTRFEWGDTLNNPLLIEKGSLIKFDVVLANPPFSLSKWGAENAESDRYNRFWRGVPPKDKGDFAFISHMIETAKKKSGRVSVIVPHGVLFRGGAEGKIRKQLLEENIVDAAIGLPAGLFSTTSIPVAILILDRSREAGGKNEEKKDVLFIEASKEFKKGKAQNVMLDEHVEKIYKTYTDRKDIEKFARVVEIDEIVENDYNLNITRYVDTFIEEDPVDIQANLKELTELEPELQKLEKQMVEYLEVLGVKKK